MKRNFVQWGFRRIRCARADVEPRCRELSQLPLSHIKRQLSQAGRYWLLDLPPRHDVFPYFLKGESYKSPSMGRVIAAPASYTAINEWLSLDLCRLLLKNRG